MKPITTTGNEFLDSHLDFNQQGVTTTGVLLIVDKEKTRYAELKGLKNVKVCLAIHDSGYKEFLIIVDGQPEHTSQSSEDIACHLDILAVLAKDKNE